MSTLSLNNPSIFNRCKRIIKRKKRKTTTTTAAAAATTSSGLFYLWFPRRFQILRSLKELAHQNKRSQIQEFGSEETTVNACSYDQRLLKLKELCPHSTDEERARFLRARNGNVIAATSKLKEYLEWRENLDLDSSEYQNDKFQSNSDEEDWDESCKLAQDFMEKEEIENNNGNNKGGKRMVLFRRRRPSKKAISNNRTKLPQIVFVYNDGPMGKMMVAKNGSLILHFIPARMDLKLAKDETYALALALYLDRKFDRNRYGYATLMMDVRDGKGWPNPPAHSIMPFIKATSSLLHQFYPERLDRCFIYNIPRPAMWIWDMLKPFLDKGLKESINPMVGSSNGLAPLPAAISDHVSQDCIAMMERTRLHLEITAIS